MEINLHAPNAEGNIQTIITRKRVDLNLNSAAWNCKSAATWETIKVFRFERTNNEHSLISTTYECSMHRNNNTFRSKLEQFLFENCVRQSFQIECKKCIQRRWVEATRRRKKNHAEFQFDAVLSTHFICARMHCTQWLLWCRSALSDYWSPAILYVGTVRSNSIQYIHQVSAKCWVYTRTKDFRKKNNSN